MSTDDIFDPVGAAAELLAECGLGNPDAVVALPGGRNNRVWRVTAEGRQFLLKRYFWSDRDPRDRQGQEWAFLQFLRHIDCILAPEPLARSAENRASLLEFIEGASPVAHEITAVEVSEALAFFREINRSRSVGKSLPDVSEACFSIDAHLATTSGRVRHLAKIVAVSEDHEAAKRFAENIIAPLWRRIEICVREGAGGAGKELLSPADRCLSPSDFGFHNSLRGKQGRLRFVDFEYAGWDDPAKTIVDFCNQPDLLLPGPLADVFREGACEMFSSSAGLPHRVRLLEPVYQIKWACICLNAFLPGNDTLRPHGRSAAGQISRAEAMVARASKSLDAPA